MGGVAAAAQPGAVQTLLDAQQVSTLAKAEVARLGLQDRFRARNAVFHPDKKVWWVPFIRSMPPYFQNGDVLVVIDDASGRICVQYGLLAGPCT